MNSALRQPISDRDNLSAAAPERLMSNDRGSIRFRLAKISAQVSAFFQVKSQVEASRHRQFRQRGPSQVDVHLSRLVTWQFDACSLLASTHRR